MKTEEKIDKIFDMVHAQNVEINKFLVKTEQYDKSVKDVEKLKSNQNKAIGGLAILSTGLTAFFTWLFKHH